MVTSSQNIATPRSVQLPCSEQCLVYSTSSLRLCHRCPTYTVCSSISVKCIRRAKAAADAGIAVESAAGVPVSRRPSPKIGLEGVVPEDRPAAASDAIRIMRGGLAAATEEGTEPAALGLLPLWMLDIVAVLPRGPCIDGSNSSSNQDPLLSMHMQVLAIAQQYMTVDLIC